ncbi:MAG: hypothetical protein QXF37_00855 [Archaeoglobaceae archaeon]
MRFIDSNVLIYAFLKPKKEPDKSLAEIKNRAVEILKRIQEGEEIATTVVHLSGCKSDCKQKRFEDFC